MYAKKTPSQWLISCYSCDKMMCHTCVGCYDNSLCVNCEKKYCKLCQKLLNKEELKYCDDNWGTELQYIGYHCSTHWCSCMPKETPWKWLTPCYICDKMMCKTCIGCSSKRLCVDCEAKLQ